MGAVPGRSTRSLDSAMDRGPNTNHEKTSDGALFARFWAGWAVDVPFILVAVIVIAMVGNSSDALFVCIGIVIAIWVVARTMVIRAAVRRAKAADSPNDSNESAV